uniref:Uncharacterized protein n=1 Tax=Chromera velia CCMP2878 TaxID=1169474 RepID=A0A0G4HD41_9ALVE|eukprot:Cvel_26183.t1-p1 / transcript=Cvel_26183.t1 / gene=Cvel_26183 / organism=Chromera_velia_CCMP2878 / gene_product=hypothetical protein / transcript_product=hypothetical protein / location=Cvel_scaffold3078:123-1353(+) / protein_length=341 / sequence_SO=supercontig / SO=protein_coding / is_pseudo=false
MHHHKQSPAPSFPFPPQQQWEHTRPSTDLPSSSSVDFAHGPLPLGGSSHRGAADQQADEVLEFPPLPPQPAVDCRLLERGNIERERQEKTAERGWGYGAPPPPPPPSRSPHDQSTRARVPAPEHPRDILGRTLPEEAPERRSESESCRPPTLLYPHEHPPPARSPCTNVDPPPHFPPATATAISTPNPLAPLAAEKVHTDWFGDKRQQRELEKEKVDPGLGLLGATVGGGIHSAAADKIVSPNHHPGGGNHLRISGSSSLLPGEGPNSFLPRDHQVLLGGGGGDLRTSFDLSLSQSQTEEEHGGREDYRLHMQNFQEEHHQQHQPHQDADQPDYFIFPPYL